MKLPPHLQYRVERHSGFTNGDWKVRFRGESEESFERFKQIKSALRQGGVRLIAPNGAQLAIYTAPRLRTRW